MRTDVPHTARVYDYFLGGKDNLPVDRKVAEGVLAVLPSIGETARQNRGFLVRSARYLVREAGLRQFLDIGTGIPTSPNLHEVAQGVDPRARVVYVDHDPLVLVHARALLASTPEGRTAYVEADLREPEDVLSSPEVKEVLDLTQPVALYLLAIMHFIPDEDDPAGLVARLMAPLPSGSHLALSLVTDDFLGPEMAAQAVMPWRSQGVFITTRGEAEVRRMLGDLEIVDPGIVAIHQWRPEPGTVITPDVEEAGKIAYAVVARKP